MEISANKKPFKRSFQFILKCPVCGKKTEDNKIVCSLGGIHGASVRKDTIMRGSSGTKLMQCQECEAYYYRLYYTSVELYELYMNHYSYTKPIKSFHYSAHKFRDLGNYTEGREAIRLYRDIEKFKGALQYCGLGDKLLHVGCGRGGTLKFFESRGLKTEGIDLCKLDHEVMKNEGLKVYDFPLELITGLEPNSYDIILMGNVIGKSLYPKDFLNKTLSLLHPKTGVLYLCIDLCPNGLVDELPRNNKTHFRPFMGHFVYYNINSLTRLIDECLAKTKKTVKIIINNNKMELRRKNEQVLD